MVTFKHDCQHLEDQNSWQQMQFSGHQPLFLAGRQMDPHTTATCCIVHLFLVAVEITVSWGAVFDLGLGLGLLLRKSVVF